MADKITDYGKAVKDKEEEIGELVSRWDADRDMLYLKKYTMMDASGRNAVPGIVNVTINLPARFFNDVVSTLGTSKEQSIIETEDKNLDTTYVEDFRKASFGSINDRLKLQGKWALNPWWDFHSCARGWGAARCLFRIGKGEDGAMLIPDIAPWDIRYVTYAVGEHGLEWAAYKTMRKKDAIEAEAWAIEKKFILEAKEAEVLDIWSTEHNEVWVGGKKIFEQPHDFGFCPVVVQPVVLGSMLLDEDSVGHRGEGVFFLIRDAVPELQRLISIMQTMNLTSVKGPKGWASKDGRQKAPSYDDATGMGNITEHETGGGVTDVPFGDAQRSAQLAYSIMSEAISSATASASDLGVIESPPASGVRAMVAGENRDQLLSPRLGLKASMNEALADMFTQQVILIGGNVEIGTPGHRRKFQTSKLDGEYEGYYRYVIKSAAVDAGRASLAAAYGNDLSWRTKAEEIYQLEDVDGEARQRNVEKAERLSPSIQMRRVLESLVEDGRNEEAELMSAEMGVTLQQMMAGQMTPQTPQKEDEPTQVLSLMGEGGGQVVPPKVEEEV